MRSEYDKMNNNAEINNGELEKGLLVEDVEVS